MSKYPLLLSACIVVCCSGSHSKTEIETAMNNYNRHLLHIDADSIALSFEANGVLTGEGQKEVKGRDSIRAHLKSFTGATVLSMQSVTQSIEMKGDSAKQQGTYIQVVRLSNSDTLELKGDYTANWIAAGKKQWLLQRMYTEHYTNRKLNR